MKITRKAVRKEDRIYRIICTCDTEFEFGYNEAQPVAGDDVWKSISIACPVCGRECRIGVTSSTNSPESITVQS